MRRFILFFLTGLLFLIACKLSVSGQNLDVLLNLIDTKQQKSVEKALNDISQAGKYTQEANEYYNEVLSLQSNFELDEKTLQKKLAKAEKQAVSLQLKADKLYASAYKSLYDICQNTISTANESGNDISSLTSTASEMMNNAKNKREEAKNIKSVIEKAGLFNDAAEMEATAIDYLITAIQVQNGTLLAGTSQYFSSETSGEAYTGEEPITAQKLPGEIDYSQSVQQKSENLAVDRNYIAIYNGYINDNSVPDPIIINRSGIVGANDISVDHARNIVFDYHYGVDYTFSEQSTPNQEISDFEDDSSGFSVTTDFEPEVLGQDNLTNNPFSEDSENSRAAFDLSAVQQASDIIFMVQIAASRIPLTRAQVWAIFPGKFTVEVTQENGWYKYRVTGFRLFSEANRVAMESGIKDAWVLAYKQGKLINLTDAREMTRVLETDVKRYGYDILKNQIDYYIQILATRSRLEKDQLDKLCMSEGLCREIIEEGMYKYQVYSGTDYDKALEIREQLANDSFIVPYISGLRITNIQDTKIQDINIKVNRIL